MNLFWSSILIAILIIFTSIFKIQGSDERFVSQGIGMLNIFDVSGKKYSCVATQVSPNSILTAGHCFNNISARIIQFRSGNGFLYNIEPSTTNHISLIDSLSDFNNDPVLLQTSAEILGVKSFLKIEKSKLIQNHPIYYLENRYDRLKFTECNASYTIDFGLIASNNCILPSGMSGTPLFQFIDDHWVVVGMYHGYMKIKENTYGIISLRENWSF
jgi:hypothetical protein